jgi:hypothetical protein
MYNIGPIIVKLLRKLAPIQLARNLTAYGFSSARACYDRHNICKRSEVLTPLEKVTLFPFQAMVPNPASF